MKSVVCVWILLISCGAFGQDDVDEREAEEARKRQAFEDGMAEIVADLNKGSFDELVDALDKDDTIDRIYGLRLIDTRIKRDFNESMDEPGRFAGFIESQYAAEAKDGIKATLLVVDSSGDRGRAVVRFDLPRFQVNYHEYDLVLEKKDKVAIIDWTDYLWGHTMTERVGLSMIQAQPNKNAVRKLIDFRNVREQQVFQVVEVLKAARDRDFDRYFNIYDGLEDALKRQRVVIKVGLDASRMARKRRNQRKMLVALAEHFPNEALYSLSLLDYYFPDRQFQKAYEALIRLQDKLGIDEPIMNSRLSSATLVLGQVEDAIAYAGKAVEQDPALELGWWAVFRANVAAEDFSAAISALERLEGDFGHTLDSDSLGKDPSMRGFLRSAEYEGWLASRG